MAMALIFTACGPVMEITRQKSPERSQCKKRVKQKKRRQKSLTACRNQRQRPKRLPCRKKAEEEDEASLELESFRSTASVAQMEITTGLTTEYLSYLCNFPVTVELEKETIVLKNLEDLDELGLEALYTEELIAAMKNCDTDKLEIQNGTMRVGDEDHYVILGTDENDVIGIAAFHP